MPFALTRTVYVPGCKGCSVKVPSVPVVASAMTIPLLSSTPCTEAPTITPPFWSTTVPVIAPLFCAEVI